MHHLRRQHIGKKDIKGKTMFQRQHCPEPIINIVDLIDNSPNSWGVRESRKHQ